jgi:hypothetical protein
MKKQLLFAFMLSCTMAFAQTGTSVSYTDNIGSLTLPYPILVLLMENMLMLIHQVLLLIGFILNIAEHVGR